ncbi:MAG: CoA transferase [Alphaproteobacteria bacterium]|jgi:crotonobetainyl-CoA:carnitine CoA-transferase CaiB-like acyl-CoA transferase|nr:CoA transferase [Alphaproteobacteria bacterium]MDP6589844.1 CoA transferase [Alphaproteobacteria bacterium]MDP6817167.1 CoA transferase [Alphaproteobacteria bacterium]
MVEESSAAAGTESGTESGGPLQGYRIIDLTTMISGPFATMILADQGADVIKVEAPGRGDHVRRGVHRSGGLAANFLNNNRNKRSIAVNLKHPEGRDILLRLAANADVFVQNFRPGVVERLGVGEADIRAVRPDIVYVSLSGFGENGPYAAKPTYDPIIQAASGLASVQGGSDDNPPRLVRTILPDKVTAVTAAQAITAALLARQRGGAAQHVRLSMLDAVVAFLWSTDMGGQTFVDRPVSAQRAASFIDLIYTTLDGHISVAVMSNREWHALAAAFERPGWLEDARFATPALRDKNIDARLTMTQEMLKTRTSADWLARLEAAGVPCAPVLTRNQLIEHEQIAASEILVESEHPQAGRLRQARPAARFDVTPPGIRHGAPLLGQHSDEILSEIGIGRDRIAALRADGVIEG